MGCAGRVYKGEGLEVNIPFPYGDMDNISVILYTSGDYSIEKTASAVDGKIYVYLTKEELDLLPDGVLRYTLEWDENSLTSNTMAYIKTPVGYSATSIEEVEEVYYQSGYTEGFQEGYEQGQSECPECSGGSGCNLTDLWIDLMGGEDYEYAGVDYYTSALTPQFNGWYKVHVQDKDYGETKYNQGYEAGYEQGQLHPSGYSINIVGSITFDQDFTFDQYTDILVIIHTANQDIQIPGGYILIGNHTLDDLKYDGITLSAGTYSFYTWIEQEYSYYNFWVEGPYAMSSGVQIPDITFNTHFEFQVYPV